MDLNNTTTQKTWDISEKTECMTKYITVLELIRIVGSLKLRTIDSRGMDDNYHNTQDHITSLGDKFLKNIRRLRSEST